MPPPSPPATFVVAVSAFTAAFAAASVVAAATASAAFAASAIVGVARLVFWDEHEAALVEAVFVASAADVASVAFAAGGAYDGIAGSAEIAGPATPTIAHLALLTTGGVILEILSRWVHIQPDEDVRFLNTLLRHARRFPHNNFLRSFKEAPKRSAQLWLSVLSQSFPRQVRHRRVQQQDARAELEFLGKWFVIITTRVDSPSLVRFENEHAARGA